MMEVLVDLAPQQHNSGTDAYFDAIIGKSVAKLLAAPASGNIRCSRYPTTDSKRNRINSQVANLEDRSCTVQASSKNSACAAVSLAWQQ